MACEAEWNEDIGNHNDDDDVEDDDAMGAGNDSDEEEEEGDEDVMTKYENEVEFGSKVKNDIPQAVTTEKEGDWTKKKITFSLTGTYAGFSVAGSPEIFLSDKLVNDIASVKSNATTVNVQTEEKGGGKKGKSATTKNGPGTSPNNVMVKTVTLKRVKSGFNCSLAMNILGIKGLVQESSTHTGIPANYVIFPMEDCRESEVLLNKPSHANIPFLKEYPGWNCDNIDKGITEFGEMVIVENNHPTLKIYKQWLDRNDQKMKESNDIQGHVAIKKDSFMVIHQNLKKDMEAGLPISDLTKMRIAVQRAFPRDNNIAKSSKALWIDSDEIHTNISSPEKQKVVNTMTRNLLVELEIEYRLI